MQLILLFAPDTALNVAVTLSLFFLGGLNVDSIIFFFLGGGGGVVNVDCVI